MGNVVLCSLVVIRLSFFRKKGDPHRTWASWLAYLLVLA
ncbi:phage holin family protein [Rahnella inusitata]